MQIILNVTGIPETKAVLRRVEALAAGRGNALKPALRAMGIEALRMVSENMQREGQATGGWRPLSPVTVILRRRGGAGKIINAGDLEAKRNRMKMLQDTGLLFNSLHSGGRGNVFELEPQAVRVGTADRKARFHQFGGNSVFDFGENSVNRKRFDQNVAKVLPGAKPKTTSSGKKSRAKRNWNPFYFKWKAILVSMHGSSRQVPARPIFWNFRGFEEQRFFAILSNFVRRKVDEIAK